MLLRIPLLIAWDIVPKGSFRGHELLTDVVYVDRRRFKRSYRKWRKTNPCHFYVKKFERIAQYRGTA